MEEFQSKADLAYTHILQDISEGVYGPGEKLVIRQLSRLYDVSEIPIREAIKRLESEGYVTHSANKSVIVCSLDRSELTNFFQVRGVLEGYATRISIDFLDEHDMAELKQINDEMKLACEQHDTARYSDLNSRFHLRIYEKNPNRELTKLIETLWTKWAITRRVFKLSPQRMDHSFHEHEHIMELMRNHRYDEAEMFVRKHKFNAGEEMVKVLS
jgi:DNA-binding GntR family transcriptional regulator